MTDEQIATLRELRHEPEWDTMSPSERDAIAAALALAGQTCGTCRHWVPDDDPHSYGTCRLKCAYFLKSDGCRLGWEAKP